MSTRSSTSIAAAAALPPAKHAAPAYMQDAANASDEEIETMLVTGIRAGLGKSVEINRESTTVVDVLASEDFGKFPDKNVAEALQRVSGVSISREFGEGERVSIRCTAPNLNCTLLNRHAIATADWFVLDKLSATRSFNCLMLPTEGVGSTEVYKGSQADLGIAAGHVHRLTDRLLGAVRTGARAHRFELWRVVPAQRYADLCSTRRSPSTTTTGLSTASACGSSPADSRMTQKQGRGFAPSHGEWARARSPRLPDAGGRGAAPASRVT